MPVQGLMVTPVVSLPQERVIDFVDRGSGEAIASLTGIIASTPIPA